MGTLWQSLERPFFVLAPMEDVTDTVFRQLIRTWSREWGADGPDVMFTEFTRVDGAVRAREASIPTQEDVTSRIDRLVYAPAERPLVAQLWGTRPEEFHRAARAIEELGFDGIDINMGCPARKIRKAGACSALISQPTLAGEIIAACRGGSGLPLSIKTRIGLDRVVTEEWIGYLLEQRVDAITIHGRIADQLSEGTADWSEVARAVRLRDACSGDGSTAIIGNGDVMSVQEGYRRVAETGVDGVMIGRGIFSDPLFFARIPRRQRLRNSDPHSGGYDTSTGTDPNKIPPWHETPLSSRLEYLREQIVAFTTNYGERRNYEILKKFFRNYVCVSEQCTSEDLAAGELLERLYETHDATAALTILNGYM